MPPSTAVGVGSNTAIGQRSTDEPAERCQGRSLDERRLRVRPCPLRPALRVTGTHRLTADLCARHARVAIDRPRLVREWLLQEDADRATRGLAPMVGRTLVAPWPSLDADFVLRVAADLGSVAAIRAALTRELKRQGWSEDLHSPLLLTVSEAVVNAIEHGSPAGAEVEVGLMITPERVAVQVVDAGRLGAAVPLGAPMAPPAARSHGRGLLLMRRLAERVQVHSGGHGTSVLLQFTRPSAMVPNAATAREA